MEVEECTELVDSTVDVLLNGEAIGAVKVEEDGFGKVTLYIEELYVDDVITVGDTLTNENNWRD